MRWLHALCEIKSSLFTELIVSTSEIIKTMCKDRNQTCWDAERNLYSGETRTQNSFILYLSKRFYHIWQRSFVLLRLTLHLHLTPFRRHSIWHIARVKSMSIITKCRRKQVARAPPCAASQPQRYARCSRGLGHASR